MFSTAAHDAIDFVIDNVIAEVAPRLEEASWWPEGTYVWALGEPLPEWSIFEAVRLAKPSAEARRGRHEAAGLPLDTFSEEGDYIDECTAFVNSRYCVLIRDVPAQAACPVLWHVMIQRRDGQPVGPERYRDFMRVRDELIGDEHEAVEVYPARSRETDVANVYHLWVMQSAVDEFPIGFK